MADSVEPSEIGAPASRRIAPGGLSALVLSSIGWIGAARIVTGVGGVLRYLIFARLLRPFDFGVFGAASAAELLLLGLTDLNLSAALVPQEGEIDEFLDTVWVAGVARAILVSLALVALARPFARFFQIGDLYTVFFVYAPFPILSGISSPAVAARLARDLEFRISLVLNGAEFAAGFIFGVGAMLFWRDWRGLIVSMYAAQIARTALTYCYYPYRPRFAFDYRCARRLFEFGGWVTARRLADFISRKLDSFAIGHFLGPQVLGQYQFAFRVGQLPTFEVAYTSGLALFPLMRRLDGRRAGRLILAAAALVVGSGIFYTAVIYRLGPRLIALTVGPKWLGALPPLCLLCVSGTIGGVLAVAAFCLDGLNAPASSFKISLVSAGVLSLLVVPFTLMFGVRGAAAAVVISVVVPLPVMVKLLDDARKRIE